MPDSYRKWLFTLPALCISELYSKIKINLNFFFHFSLWCLRFFEGLQGVYKNFLRTAKKCENKNVKLILCLRLGSGREGLVQSSDYCRILESIDTGRNNDTIWASYSHEQNI